MSALSYQQSLNLALDYVAMNPTRFLFPIKAGSKFPPLIKNNLADASNDPEQLTAWAKKWPGCNWGVSHRKSNLLVVDIDQKPGKEGETTFDELDLEYGFPETEENRTPSGGRHLVYEGAHVFALGENGFGKDIDSPNYTMIAGCQLRRRHVVHVYQSHCCGACARVVLRGSRSRERAACRCGCGSRRA
jgi:hypothetical protein